MKQLKRVGLVVLAVVTVVLFSSYQARAKNHCVTDTVSKTTAKVVKAVIPGNNELVQALKDTAVQASLRNVLLTLETKPKPGGLSEWLGDLASAAIILCLTISAYHFRKVLKSLKDDPVKA